MRTFGCVVMGLFSVAASVVTVLLISIGSQNNWTSDGPGMLIIMVAVVFFGSLALVGWLTTASLMVGEKPRS